MTSQRQLAKQLGIPEGRFRAALRGKGELLLAEKRSYELYLLEEVIGQNLMEWVKNNPEAAKEALERAPVGNQGSPTGLTPLAFDPNRDYVPVPQPKYGRRKMSDVAEKVALDLYINQGWNTAQVAEHLNSSPMTLNRLWKRHGYRKKPRKPKHG